ncbi:MAG: endolytic transglycosylase MltG [Solirubrobacterales bacterium]|nr:endolytic transglycosylase MltG [Solirubrobacterales bacterium]
MAESPERTARQREAARLERERQRAERVGDVPEPPALEDDLNPDDGHEVVNPEGRWEQSREGHRDADRVGDPDEDRVGDRDEIRVDDQEEDLVGDDEIASGIRGMSRRSRLGAPRRARPPRERSRKPRLPQRPRPARERSRKSRLPERARAPHSRAGRAFSLLALLAAGALIWFLIELFQPFHGSGEGSVTVTIPHDFSSSQVGNLLSREGVISSSFFFRLRATLAGDRGDLRAGTYQLKRDMSYDQVLKILTTPPPPAKISNLTVIEGSTRRQLDALLRAQGIGGGYLADTRHSSLLDPRAYGAPPNTDSLEGFLFPSTYQLRDPIQIPALVADQLRTFKQQFAGVNLIDARRAHLSPYDVLTIASMVQAEAGTAHDRPLVASVIYNRLRLGMPLQIDATTRYATGNYTRPLTQAELNSPSPYNTRNRKGLTPTPIDNPGLAAMQAAAHPAQTDYLYFVVKPCGNGQQAFASSYAQFQQLEENYSAARAGRGGRSPEFCR